MAAAISPAASVPTLATSASQLSSLSDGELHVVKKIDDFNLGSKLLTKQTASSSLFFDPKNSGKLFFTKYNISLLNGQELPVFVPNFEMKNATIYESQGSEKSYSILNYKDTKLSILILGRFYRENSNYHIMEDGATVSTYNAIVIDQDGKKITESFTLLAKAFTFKKATRYLDKQMTFYSPHISVNFKSKPDAQIHRCFKEPDEKKDK